MERSGVLKGWVAFNHEFGFYPTLVSGPVSSFSSGLSQNEVSQSFPECLNEILFALRTFVLVLLSAFPPLSFPRLSYYPFFPLRCPLKEFASYNPAGPFSARAASRGNRLKPFVGNYTEPREKGYHFFAAL